MQGQKRKQRYEGNSNGLYPRLKGTHYAITRFTGKVSSETLKNSFHLRTACTARIWDHIPKHRWQPARKEAKPASEVTKPTNEVTKPANEV